MSQTQTDKLLANIKEFTAVLDYLGKHHPQVLKEIIRAGCLGQQQDADEATTQVSNLNGNSSK